MSTLSWVVVATEKDPARAAWTRAAQDAGVSEPRFVPWSAVLGSEAEFQAGEVVFFERLHPLVPANPVGGQRARYEEFKAGLEQLSAAVEKAGATMAADPEKTLLALDRTKRDEFLRQNGVPLLEPSDPAAEGHTILRPRFAASDDWIIDSRQTQLFRHRSRTGPEVWRGPSDSTVDRDELSELAGLLAGDGIHAVESLHRVYLDGTYYDIRFAVVDGEVTHAAGVVRQEVVPREWYGGKRRELDDFLERFGVERWERVVELARRTASCFPGFRSLGVDLSVDNFESEYVVDIDPFGAHLPGLAGRPDTGGEGRSVRAAVLRSLSTGS
jgi:hypothetical protein